MRQLEKSLIAEHLAYRLPGDVKKQLEKIAESDSVKAPFAR